MINLRPSPEGLLFCAIFVAQEYPHPFESRPVPSLAWRASAQIVDTSVRIANGANLVRSVGYLASLATTAVQILLTKKHKNLPRGIIHGDLHFNNILCDQGKQPVINDFDRVRPSTLIEDIVQLASEFCVRRSASGEAKPQETVDKKKLEAMLQGYHEVRPLTPQEVAALPDLIYERSIKRDLGAQRKDIFELDDVPANYADNAKLSKELKAMDFFALLDVTAPTQQPVRYQ